LKRNLLILRRLRDAGQIMDDLIPMSQQDGGVFIGDAGWDYLSSNI
jgi:hypothetical protein